MKKLHFILMIFSIIWFIPSDAQTVYFTQKARIVVSAHFNGTEIQLKSDQLLARIDYETALFNLSVDPSTFRSGIDSIDRALMNLDSKTIEMNGKFEVEGINTKGHPPLDFNFTGELNNYQVVEGRAHLEHIANNTFYACMLSLDFELKADNLHIDLKKYPIHDPVTVTILQSVLPRTTD